MLFRSDRKSTRLNSSHLVISYAVFCLKKKTRLHRRDKDENRFKGFPRATRRTGQAQRVADDCEARLRVEEGVSKTAGSARCGVELAATPALRVQPLCVAADISGDGRCQQGRRHPLKYQQQRI